MRQEKKGSPDASPPLKLSLHAGCTPSGSHRNYPPADSANSRATLLWSRSKVARIGLCIAAVR